MRDSVPYFIGIVTAISGSFYLRDARRRDADAGKPPLPGWLDYMYWALLVACIVGIVVNLIRN